jgi:hypothetical protein
MKKILNSTIATYLACDEKKALQTFCENTQNYAGNEEKLLRSIRSLFKNFADSDDREKRCRALLSAMCYDMIGMGKGYNAGLKCMQIADYPIPRKGLGICETIYFSAEGHPRTLPTMADIITAKDNVLVHFTSEAYLVRIGSVDNIYCYKDEDGALALLNVIDINEAIICDEEQFAGESPLYFTESSHFISPVFQLNVASIIINQLLKTARYPYLRIKQKVLYTGHNTLLINEEDMWTQSWRGRDLENIVARSTILDAQGRNAFTSSLLNIVCNTSSMYDNIISSKIYEPEKIKQYIKCKLNP